MGQPPLQDLRRRFLPVSLRLPLRPDVRLQEHLRALQHRALAAAGGRGDLHQEGHHEAGRGHCGAGQHQPHRQ